MTVAEGQRKREEEGNNQAGNQKWTTFFYIPADAAIEVQRILDTLRSKDQPKTDPQVAEDEAKDLYP